ncbi:MAG TPA: GGDEF domain-containing protein [Jatrophihabitantaceae bacterium]|nr:GGDEF domain-containing protein [Jatrophihabitantaceae bacterium]
MRGGSRGRKVALPTSAREGGSDGLIHGGDILRLIAAHAPLDTTLRRLAELVEEELARAKASILLLTADGQHIKVAAAPSLPEQFSASIDGETIGPTQGTCGVAAYERRVVITTDIGHDPNWEPWRDGALALGLASCWSTPFVGADNEVLGTFAVYFGEPREPSEGELILLHEAGHLAAVAVQQDASQRTLRDLARTDPLTHLANREVLADRLRAAQVRSIRSGGSVALMLLGVDGIAAVNESFGHAAGDELLRLIAQRLVIAAGPSATVARMWGDEFAVLREDVRDSDDAVAIATRLRQALVEPFDVDGLDLFASAGLGLAVLGPDTAEPDPLRIAGAALERAKALGRGEIVMHDVSTAGRADLVTLAPALRRGIAAQEFGLAYQPIVDLRSGRVVRHEALLRWASGQHQGVPPDTFVPLAERIGLVGDLGRYALGEALGELYRQSSGLGVSVNVSVHQLSDDSLPATVDETLAKYDLPASRLTLEVTEGVLLRSGGVGWRILSTLRERGVRIAIDDFGTGFGQLSYLRQFPFDEIKIDRSFIADLGDDAHARAIVGSVVSLAAALGSEVVAEGVEQPSQRSILLDLGCQYGQGYLFGVPGVMQPS